MDYALKEVIFRFPSFGPEAELMCLGVFSRFLPATPGISQAMNAFSGPGLAGNLSFRRPVRQKKVFALRQHFLTSVIGLYLFSGDSSLFASPHFSRGSCRFAPKVASLNKSPL
jgi:hypothetical protein